MAIKKSLTFDIFGKDKTASKTMKGVGKNADSLGKTMGKVGKGIALGFAAAAAGVVAFAVDSVKSLARIEKIGAQTDSVIKSMGASSWTTKDQVVALSDRLEKLTATESESIQEGANLLLTFKNIRNEAGDGNDIFDRTTTLMVDMARAMGTDASGSAVQLGKALNDPINGISALSRVGITFTDEQKEMIKTLVESGDTMGAQRVILDELQKQFGGSGAAYADTFAGKIDTLRHNLGAAGEAVMMQLMPELEGLVDWITGDGLVFLDGLVDWIKEEAIPGFKGLVDWVVKYKDILGPAAVALATLTAAQWVLNAAMAANPVGAVIMGLAAIITLGTLIATNFDTVTKWVFRLTGGAVRGFLELGVGAARGVESVVNALLRGLAPVLSMINGVLRAFGMATINLPTNVNFTRGLTAFMGRFNEALLLGQSGGVGAITNDRLNGSRDSGGGRRNSVRRFADGGIVRPTAGGTNAIIGEAGDAEAVIPLSRSALAKYGIGGGDTYVVNLSGFAVGSEDDLARRITTSIDRAKRSGKISRTWNN